MGRGAQRAALHLRQPERRVVGGHDHIGVTHQSDTTADAETIDCRHDRYLAFVDGFECREAAAVGVDEGAKAFGCLHLLDVHAGVEAPALGAQDHHVGAHLAACRGDGVGQLEPAA